MFKNFLKIAVRTITRNPFYSIVNIAGLSIGIAFTFLIAAYAWNEVRVNTSLKNAGNQYIIQSKWKEANQGFELGTLGPLAKSLKENYPNLIANYYRYDGITSNISKGEKAFREGLQIGDSTMLDMYGFALSQGNPHTALATPFSVVISTSIAKKYFGRPDVLGETLSIENFSGSKHDFAITGVLKDFPRNSVTRLTDDYPNNIFISTDNLGFFGRNMDWTNASIASYIELKNGVSPQDLTKPMELLMKNNVPPFVNDNMQPYLVSLNKYYLSANNGLVRKMVFALCAIALFILLMAVINFINMSVSRSSTRLREIGVRKVLGSMKKELTFQFLIESIILVGLACCLAMIIYAVSRSLFSHLLGKEIPALNEFPLYFAALPLLLVFITGGLAGIYPAFVLSSMKAVESLKGKLSSVKEKIALRKLLVAFQFGIAAVAFSGAMIVSKQVGLFFSNNLGYDKSYVVTAQVPRDWSPEGVRRMQSLRNSFAALPVVNNISLSYEIPDGNNSGDIGLYKEGEDSTKAVASQVMMTDEYYASTYNIPMAAGIFFSQPGAYTDSSRIVINVAQVKALGWNSPEEALEKKVLVPGSPLLYTIAGVVADYHAGSMQKAIPPLTFFHVGTTNTFRFFSFSLKPGDIHHSITTLQKQWSASMPGTPFEYTFMDDTLRKLYKTEIQLEKASYTATALSLIIVLLGVIGLVALSVQKRIREIGIRKVLGASVKGIILLFVSEFLWVILAAGVVAFPVSWWLMNSWLSDYVYRIRLNAAPFVISVAGLAVLTAILIAIQTFKAGMTNPTKNLRTE